MSAEAADIARRAAEIQQERGHCKGKIRDAEGRVCLWGSLITAARESGTEWETVRPLLQREIRRLNLDDTSLLEPEDWVLYGINWNDRAETGERDVAKVLLQVADRLEIAP